MGLAHARIRFVRALSFIDLLVVGSVFLLIYGLIGVAHEWSGPFHSKTEIDLSLTSLPGYTLLSVVRGFVAYGLSLGFAIFYGYLAAHSKKAEKILIPLLDILQSIPVLGFLPGLVLVLVNLFPTTQVGLEFACIIMIFTGQVWNMAFSFYASLKSVPQELKELITLYRLNKVEILRSVELPSAMNGLLWNSMLSMAGGWFFLMVTESFRLGDQDFRLPGIGSYMTVAYERGDGKALFAGLFAMVLMITVVDRFLWAPLVVWSERFKMARDTSQGGVPRSLVIEWLDQSHLFRLYYRLLSRIKKQVERYRDRQIRLRPTKRRVEGSGRGWGLRIAWFGLSGIGVVALFLGVRGLYRLLVLTDSSVWLIHLRDTGYTFLRVSIAVVLGSVWTIPVGVAIGIRPQWTRRLQPVVQVVASFPAPMLFPLVTWVLLQWRISIEFGSIFLMLLAAQWYILFNVISGATLIPRHMIEVGKVFRVKGATYWKAIILPAIFPSLLNGWITATGGAWNASIVSEYVHAGRVTLTATGIGASISQAAQSANFAVLASGIVTMVSALILLNRFFWGPLYRLAETRFRLD